MRYREVLRCERCKQPSYRHPRRRFVCHACGLRLCADCAVRDFGTTWCSDWTGRQPQDCKDRVKAKEVEGR